MEQLLTRNDILDKLRDYAVNPDDDVIIFKERIKDALIRCPELLYALNNKSLVEELFDEDGMLNAYYDENNKLVPTGEWDRYFGYNIRDGIFIPEVQHQTDVFLCYTVGWDEGPRYNSSECYIQITFTALCPQAPEIAHDPETGLSRHDLIGSIIRERFNWSNIFGSQCRMVYNKESITDTHFLTRTIVFETTVPNAMVKTGKNGTTSVINYKIRK